MKQKDIVLIIVVAFVAGVFSLLLTQTFFAGQKNKQMTAEVVEPISAEFKDPDESVFNSNAINPTQLIQIGDTSNTSPF